MLSILSRLKGVKVMIIFFVVFTLVGCEKTKHEEDASLTGNWICIADKEEYYYGKGNMLFKTEEQPDKIYQQLEISDKNIKAKAFDGEWATLRYVLLDENNKKYIVFLNGDNREIEYAIKGQTMLWTGIIPIVFETDGKPYYKLSKRTFVKH